MRIDSLKRAMPDTYVARGLVITDAGRRYLAMDWLDLLPDEPDDLHCRNGHRLLSPRGYCAACSVLTQRRKA